MKMKIIMILLWAAMSLCVVQATSDTTHISASYPSRLELVLPDDGVLQMQGASAGEAATVICQILVRSNVDWALKVDGEYYGQMQKVTNSKTGIDSKKRLKRPMKFRYAGTVLSPVEKDLSGSALDYCHGPPGEIQVPTEFKQEFSWTDPPAQYRMNVMFRLSPD
jgi:hypothetical protein